MNTLLKMKHLILVASLALAFPLAAQADAPPAEAPDYYGGGPGHGHDMPGCMMAHGPFGGGMFRGEDMFEVEEALPPMLRHLQLSDTQQDKIFAIMHAQAPQAHELGKAVRKAHRELHELATGASYDEAKAKALADALGKAVAESTLLHVRTHRQVLEVLTPEQRQALEQRAERGPGMGHGPWHQGDHPPMPPR